MKIVAIAGSTRKASSNKKLLRVAEGVLKGLGAEVDVVDLKDLAIPLYDGDLEESAGRPAGVTTLRDKMAAAQGLLVVSPEYNRSVPPVLKNAIDWASRPPGPSVYQGKVVALMGASGGPYGTARVQPLWRATFGALGAWVVPGGVELANADDAFKDDGGQISLVNDRAYKAVVHLMEAFVVALKRFG